MITVLLGKMGEEARRWNKATWEVTTGFIGPHLRSMMKVLNSHLIFTPAYLVGATIYLHFIG